jgi:hypothetical protein
MPISLEAVRCRLSSRIQTLDRVFERYAILKLQKRLDRSAMQEGLVSALWQSWCAFCRETMIASASGTTTSLGATVTSPYLGRSEMEIAYVARELAFNRAVRRVVALSGRHLEPTWGDLKKLNLIAAGLHSSNQPQLLSAFGAGIAIGDLQLCRNVSAHLNKGGLSEISAARVRYRDTKFVHPSDVIFWVDPHTNDYLWKTWVDEILILSELAIA